MYLFKPYLIIKALTAVTNIGVSNSHQHREKEKKKTAQESFLLSPDWYFPTLQPIQAQNSKLAPAWSKTKGEKTHRPPKM